jgi:hypothetical protein
MSEQALIDALEKLTDKIDEMSGNLGRGTKARTSQVPGKSGSNAKTPEEKNAAKSMDALDKMARAGIKTQKESNKANEEQTDSVKELAKAQGKATEEQRKLERSMERAKEGFTSFGKSLFNEKTNVADALGSLGGTLAKSTGVIGRSFGGMATGIGLALGLMQNFADAARDLGTFADLGAFQIGSVRQAKVLSGLGDSFIKVIEQSNGTFKGLGSTSQQAVENLSNLSRSFRYGSSYLNSAMKKSLGTDLVKSVDKAAYAIAAMGLSQEEQANLEASVLSTTMMTAKNEDDAKKKFVEGMLATSTSARGLSDTFGMSAKKIILAMAEFRGSQAGKFAALEGNAGADAIYAVLKEKFPSLSSDPTKMANIAAAYAEGNMAKVYSNLEQGNDGQLATQLFDMFQGTIGKDGKLDEKKLNANVEQKRSTMETMYASRKDLQGYGGDADKYAQSAIELKSFFKDRDIAQSVKPRDEAAKSKINTSELENIKSMNSLTAALESLRGTLVGISAAILGLTGAIGGIALAGGLGALTGATGGIGKAASAAGGMVMSGMDWMTNKYQSVTGKYGPPVPDGLKKPSFMDKMSDRAKQSGVGGKIGELGSKIGEKASGAMGGFADFLGKLGDDKTIKGAGTLALLGGALAMAAHGFDTFGKVTWEGMLKGTIAIGGLIVLARGIGEASTGMLKGAAAIALLGATMWVAGKGFSTFNDLNWESMLKGVVALGAFSVAAILMGTALPAIALGAVAIGALGLAVGVLGVGMIPAAYATNLFSEAIVKLGEVSGGNLIAIGAGLAAIGAGAVVFAAGMAVASAGSILTGIMSIFGAKSPLDRIKEFVPMADKISLVGAGIQAFGAGVASIASSVASVNTDILTTLKDKLLEFAAAGSSDEIKLTAEYLSSIGTSLGTIANIGDIRLPSTSSMSVPTVSTDISSSLSPGESIVNDKASSSLTPEAISQLMGYLSSMQNDLAAIRGNTKTDSFSAPVRLS